MGSAAAVQAAVPSPTAPMISPSPVAARAQIFVDERGVANSAEAGSSNGVINKEEARRRKEAKASPERYMFHYERWAGNLRSLEKVRQDMDELERPSVLEGMAAAVGLSAVTELGFMVEAYEQIAHARRVLRWSHAYGYYLDPARDGKKRELFDYLQGL